MCILNELDTLWVIDYLILFEKVARKTAKATTSLD